MTTPIIFDFGTFYKYYTNKNNVRTSTTPLTLQYYDNFVVKSKKKSGKFIVINGNNFYIDILPKNVASDRITDAVLFTTPTLINGALWDTHYHFGVRRNFTKKSRNIHNKINAVYFHKTTQTPTRKLLSNCYFFTNQDITNVENIECLESGTGSRISGNDKFPMTGPDFAIIREIIQRPFLGVRFGGKTRKHMRRRKHTRKCKSIM
jgi:hypothetical protein